MWQQNLARGRELLVTLLLRRLSSLSLCTSNETQALHSVDSLGHAHACSRSRVRVRCAILGARRLSRRRPSGLIPCLLVYARFMCSSRNYSTESMNKFITCTLFSARSASAPSALRLGLRSRAFATRVTKGQGFVCVCLLLGAALSALSDLRELHSPQNRRSTFVNAIS